MSANLNINVNVIKLGNIKVKKIDEHTGKALANAKLKFEYDGKDKEIVTDSNAITSIEDIPEGTTVIISEVRAPNGYLTNKEKIPFELKYAGQTVEVTSTAISHKDTEQKGKVILIKEDEKNWINTSRKCKT